MPTQPPATTIGKYQILGLVGEGAMGAVYRALDPVLQRPVAIKVMSDAVAREQELRERFLREAQAAGSLQHPNVVTIYDFGEVDGHLFIAMEFLDGEDLEALLARQVPLSLPAKLGIAVDVLGGLSYAHRRGIVHRDIKPANIRVTEDERAKIMDFGVAHLTSQKMTRTGMTMGTPNYMAPEQVSAGPIGPHTDVFSLGAVLYELLTNAKPFAAETLHAVLFKIVSEPTAPPSTRVPGLPPELDAIVLKSLAKDPAQRYQTASEMANDLTALRARMGTSASVSLNARLSTAVPAAPAAPAGPAAPGPASGALDTTPAERAAAGRGALMATGALALAALGVGGWAFARRSASAPATQAANVVAQGSAVAQVPAVAPSPAAAAEPPPPAPSPETATPPASAARATPAIPAPPPRPEPLPASRPATTAAAARGGAPSAVAATGAATSTASQGASETPRVAAPAAAPVAAPVVAPPVPGASLPAPAVSAPSATPSSANVAGEIAEVVARYARAITARDLGAVRAAYPAITPAQEGNFQRFFASVRELRASFGVSGLDVDGASADARLDGAYEFVTSNGEKQRSPVSFRASFRRDGERWVLAAVR